MTARPLPDDDWLAALAGHADGDRETALLRDLLRADETRAADANLDHDWQRLRFALRREARANRPRWFDPAVFAQAAMFLLVLGGVALLAPTGPTLPTGDDEVVLRGQVRQEVFVADPAAAARHLAARLDALGVASETKPGPGLVELRVRLAPPLNPKVRGLLATEGIESPGHGELRILFVEAARD